MAAQGLRDMDDGAEKIADLDELTMVKRAGRRVMASTLVSAVMMTALFMLAP